VQLAIRQTVDDTGLPLSRVVVALLIAACQPKTVPQSAHECADILRDNPISQALTRGRCPAHEDEDVEPYLDSRRDAGQHKVSVVDTRISDEDAIGELPGRKGDCK
jgi:hypothetical protein